MDSYSGREPRKFISFHVGKENNDQPQQTPVETEMATIPEQTKMGETHQLITSSQANEHSEPMNKGSSRQQVSPNLSLLFRLFATDSSGSKESWGTYITCKMSQLEEAAAKKFVEVTEFAQRKSISGPLSITPSIQQYDHNRLSETSHAVVVFLDSPKQVVNDSGALGLFVRPGTAQPMGLPLGPHASWIYHKETDRTRSFKQNRHHPTTIRQLQRFRFRTYFGR